MVARALFCGGMAVFVNNLTKSQIIVIKSSYVIALFYGGYFKDTLLHWKEEGSEGQTEPSTL